MLLSIVIPTLNEEKYLPRLLKSIKEQDFSDFEIIVSDGNSSDKTKEIAHSFGAKVFVDQRRGPSRQRNLGATQAQGDTILFLDADDVLPDNKFVSSIFAEFKKRNLAVAGFFVRFGSSKIAYRFFGLVYNGATLSRLFYKPIAAGAGIMITKDLHHKINGFDETLAVLEDHDYVSRASTFGKFGILKSRKIIFSVRRIEKEGSAKMLKTWLKMAFYDLAGKRAEEGKIEYEFGAHNK